MKKRFLSILFAILICFIPVDTIFATKTTARLYDEADLLTEVEESVISEKLDRVSELYNVDFVIVTVETTGLYSADEYVNNFYDENNLGYGANRDGVLLLITMMEREYRILSNGLGADAISMNDIDSISDSIVSYLSSADYVGAFNTFIDECEYQINGEINGFPFPFVTSLMICLGIGLLVALVSTGIMAAQLKSVKKQPTAKEYTKSGSMKLTVSRDFFLYRSVHRQKRETSSSSSSSRSSGSSRNVGGGRF